MFLPAFEICLDNASYTGPGAIIVSPGQWVTCDGAKGRVVNPETFQVLWRFTGETFESFNLRFKKARQLSKGLKKARGALRTIYTAKSQLTLALPESEEVLLKDTINSLHHQINALRVRLNSCLNNVRKGEPGTLKYTISSRTADTLQSRIDALEGQLQSGKSQTRERRI